MILQNFSINYWIEKGADPKKLVMGLPLYGQSFSLADSGDRGLNAKSYGPGEAGEFTRAGGFLAFYEVGVTILTMHTHVEQHPKVNDEFNSRIVINNHFILRYILQKQRSFLQIILRRFFIFRI